MLIKNIKIKQKEEKCKRQGCWCGLLPSSLPKKCALNDLRLSMEMGKTGVKDSGGRTVTMDDVQSQVAQVCRQESAMKIGT
jgi:hypothetical protein